MSEPDKERRIAEDTLKNKYAEFRLAAAQIKQLQEQLQALEEKRGELGTAAGTLDELKGTEKKARMLVPVSDGMFASATLDSNEELIVNVGSDVCVKKTVEEAKDLLNAKLKELTSYQEELLGELQRLTENADKLEKELGDMLKEEQ
ncbi:prefoldin subunit alpha [Candidatus Woesearchaeota archaeon]|nr:prefoldin subunit alpha [Candidatus Woesearchaeota archaeon]